VSDALTIGAGAVKVIELAAQQGWIDRLRYAFSKKQRVLVLGSTGTGKTNFLQSLTESVPEAIDQMNRTQVAEQHRIKVDKTPFVFVDTPGDDDEGHRAQRNDQIRAAISEGLSGAINVVSYGLHEYRTNEADVFDATGAPKAAFLESHRKVEIDMLAQWRDLSAIEIR